MSKRNKNNHHQRQHTQRNSGQVMLLSVLVLGGVMIGTATIAGALLIYQIRNVNESLDFSRAFFAADSGTEVVSWCLFGGECDPEDPPELMFTEPSTSYSSALEESGNEFFITVRGFSGRSVRILETVFIGP